MSASKVKIDYPCPIAFSKLDKADFNCSSCKKKVVDFRGKSIDEIKTTVTPGICGVFDSHQVKAPTSFGSYKRSLFKALTILSFIGFNVKPLSANAYEATVKHKVEYVKVEKEEESEKKKRRKRKRKHAWWNPFKKKQKNFPSIGCPSF